MLKFFALHVALCVSVCAGIYIAKENCPNNEEYLLCGSACPANCSDTSPQCNDDCVEGCFCLSGYLRDGNGTCVSSDGCVTNITCGENEEFLPCGTACAASCSVPEPEICGLTCSMGCFCREGYYRDETSQKCVTLDKCPPQNCFNQNEAYDLCNAKCEPTCSEPAPICTKICSAGCICAPGYLRGPNGDCVSVNNCPSNGTSTGALAKYLNTINKILHLSYA
ncbi:serine protease inhibitor swm-1 [Danaus plexippus]|uniref:serine protease inhibitor swm-1 n=1 Tax=Danaus plexippus TaxID=13037 RepID=UPI002AAFA4D8|nr:serine protease inhibitor swm-1 [Danaus plexippus]